MYSKLESVEVYNFMGYTHSVVFFDDSNILNIKGYNGSGKSAFLKAIAICFFDAYSRKQASLIKYGSDYFRVVAKFSDGISIVRDKYINGQSLYEMYRGNELVFSTKQGSKLTRVDGVPEIIQDYLGLCVMNGKYLNYQTRDDKLWLIETTGSDNYGDFNEILKSGEIARAVSLINSDRNKLGSEITEMESQLQNIELRLLNSSEMSEDFLLTLTEREAYAQGICSQSDKLDGLLGLVDSIDSLGFIPTVSTIPMKGYKEISELHSMCSELSSLVLYPSVGSIDVDKYKVCSELFSLYTKLNTYRGIPEVNKLDSDKVKNASEITDLLEKLKELTEYPIVQGMNVVKYKSILSLVDMLYELSELGLDSFPNINGVNVERVDSISEVYRLSNLLSNEVMSQLSDISTEVDRVSRELCLLVKEAEEEGIEFVRCENCGSYTSVSLGGK